LSVFLRHCLILALSSTRNWICRTTLHRFSACVTFSCSSYVMCNVRWRQTQLSLSYMLSLAAAWITATVFCRVFASVYWGNCSQSKMPLLVWLPTHELWSKLSCWFTSVCVVWRLRIWASFVDRFQLFRSVSNCGLTPQAFFTSQEQSFADVGSVTWNSLPAELRTLKLSLFCLLQAFDKFSLQQLLTAACSAFVVTSFLICTVYKCPYYYYCYYYYYLLHVQVLTVSRVSWAWC